MSLVLAPIHDMMYQKVLRQDRMSEALLSKAEASGWATKLRGLADKHAPAAELRPLAEIIDSGNIHGWLSATVVQSERRLAFIAQNILQDHATQLDALQGAVRSLGEREALSQGLAIEEAFEQLSNALLDGMPCDRSLTPPVMGAEQITWETAQCSHAPYWSEPEAPPEVYYKLRDAWISGALAHSGYAYTRDGLHHRLYREG